MQEIFKKAAKAGGLELMKFFGGKLSQTVKSEITSNFATEADYASERAIISVISKALPEFNIQSEESGAINHNSEYTVIIDPLDGTHNFYHGIPLFTTVIALLYKDKPIIGVIYYPVLDYLYFAEPGLGSWRDGQRLKCGNRADFKNAVISYAPGYHIPRSKHGELQTVLHKKGIERFMVHWSLAFDFCLLAEDKIDGVIVYDVEMHDFLAGELIGRESGAVVTKFGKSDNRFIISTPSVHEQLVESVGSFLT